MKSKNDSKIYLAEGRKWVYVCEIPELLAIVKEPDDDLFIARVGRIALEEEFMEDIKKAVRDGELITRNQYSHILKPYAVGAQLRGSVVSIDEFSGFVSRYGVEVEVNEPAIGDGRYTLEDAVTALSKGTGEQEKGLLVSLTTAVANGEIKIYRPGSNMSYEPLRILPYNDEVYWDEINEWIEKELPRIDWRFPNPKHDADELRVVKHQTTKKTVPPSTENNYREFNRWLYQIWVKEGCPNASDFFRRLSRYVDMDDSPIISRITATGCETFTFKTKRMKTNKTWVLKTLQNKISEFKKQPKQ